MSISNAIIPNNFEIFSGGDSGGDDGPKTYSTGYIQVGGIAIAGTLSNQLPLALPAGKYKVSYCVTLAGSNAPGTVNNVHIVCDLMSGATVVDSSELFRKTDTTLGAAASYGEGNVANSVVVDLATPETISLQFTLPATNQATSTTYTGIRGITAIEVLA